MLKLKIKQVLLALGNKSPQGWLQTYCNMTQSKAYNLVNGKQKSISFADLSKICNVLQCTPDELFWWDNSAKSTIMEWHPCIIKLAKPDKEANWMLRVGGLNPDRVETLKNFMLTLEAERINESKTVFQEVKKREAEENSKKIEGLEPKEPKP